MVHEKEVKGLNTEPLNNRYLARPLHRLVFYNQFFRLKYRYGASPGEDCAKIIASVVLKSDFSSSINPKVHAIAGLNMPIW